MKTRELAPLLIDICIQYLKSKDIGTKYRPSKNSYLIDTYLMVRILRKNGNMQAQVFQDESVLMNQFLKKCLEEKIIKSVLTNKRYIVEEISDRRRLTLKFKRVQKVNGLGRKPKYLMRGNKNVRASKECN